VDENNLDFDVDRLGECRVSSPMSGVQFVGEDQQVLYHTGPRNKIYYDPSKLKCGIVTCGGLCPGLNDVIRAIVMGLHYHYGVKTVFGFSYGYEGLSYKYGHTPIELTPDVTTSTRWVERFWVHPVGPRMFRRWWIRWNG
jgi:6-phosphofructokinase 1